MPEQGIPENPTLHAKRRTRKNPSLGLAADIGNSLDTFPQ